jgi:photosystem II stability/assembly factor-like uncharacterized protein
MRVRAAGVILLLALAVGAPAHAATLLGLIDTGELYTSANGGVSWAGLSTLPVRDAVGLQARFSTSELYLASRSGGVYKSLDGGTSWAAVGTVTAADVSDLLVRSDGAVMLLTASGAIYRSTDQGATFTGIAALAGSDFVSLTQRTDARLYALTRTGEVYESTDLGVNWTGKSALTVANAVRIRSLGQTLYVMTETGDIARSTDAAATWSVVGTLSQVGMRGLVKNGTTLVAASREGHIATSTDGVSWTWQGSINQLALTALATNAPATTGVEEPSPPGGVALGEPYPNPSPDGAGLFPVELDRDGMAVLELCDLAGRVVARRPPDWLPAGAHSVAWNPRPERSGLYFVRLRAAGSVMRERRWVVLH